MPAHVNRRALSLALASLALLFVLAFAGEARAGYTHYWRWHGRPDDATLRASIDEMNRLVEARRGMLEDTEARPGAAAVFALALPFGDGGDLPEISFNGIGEQGHKHFGFPLAPFTMEDPSFQFTKTAHKPYDEVVTACLIVARDHFPPALLTIHSDGEWAEWARGAALYEQVLGRPAHDPVERNGQAAVAADPGTTAPRSSLARNLLLSALVFAALAIAYALFRRAN